jgi:hypothetical protein
MTQYPTHAPLKEISLVGAFEVGLKLISHEIEKLVDILLYDHIDLLTVVALD